VGPATAGLGGLGAGAGAPAGWRGPADLTGVTPEARGITVPEATLRPRLPPSPASRYVTAAMLRALRPGTGPWVRESDNGWL